MVSFTNSTALVYVGLLHNEADPLSLKQVTDLMPLNMEKRMVIIEVMSNALSDAFGVEDEKSTKKKAKENGTGMKPKESATES